MKIRFRPDLKLTLICLIMLAILLRLGVWQYERLQWKTQLLAEIESVATAPPLNTLSEVAESLDQDQPIDFRRINLSVSYGDLNPMLRVYQPFKGGVGWRHFTTVSDGTLQVFAGFDTLEDGTSHPALVGTDEIAGYVRLVRPDMKSRYDSTPDENRWFGFNPVPDRVDWADLVPSPTEMRFFIDVLPGQTDANLLPPKRPDLPNNHFQYMMTWFIFAFILVIIYFAMHRRQGRLTWS